MSGYPVKNDFRAGDPISNIPHDWLNTVANVINTLNNINRTNPNGINWQIVLTDPNQTTAIDVITDVKVEDNEIVFKKKTLIVQGILGVEKEADLTIPIQTVNMVAATGVQEDGCLAGDDYDWYEMQIPMIAKVKLDGIENTPDDAWPKVD
jgi:hypothetical protein